MLVKSGEVSSPTLALLLLFLQINNVVNLRKSWGFFRKPGCLRMCNCVEIFHAINVNYQL